MTIERIAVIGAGATGRRLAVCFAAAGFDTVLEDILPSNLRKAAEYASAAVGRSPGERLARELRFASTVEEAVRQADMVLDCVPDELESKLEIFSMLDRMAPPLAVLVTPTRHLSIADLASCTYRPERCLSVRSPSGDFLENETLVLTATTLTAPEVLQAVIDFWSAHHFEVQLTLDPAEPKVAAGTLF